MERSYVAENKAALERMRALIERLSDEELSRLMDAGWTVAGVLAHIAFWDERTIVLMDKWASGIAPSSADCQPPEVDRINDASKPLAALPVRTAAELALQIGEEADARIAALSDKMLAQITAAGTTNQSLSLRSIARHTLTILNAIFRRNQ